MVIPPAVRDFVMFNEPAKELEPVPEERNCASVVTLPVAWIPSAISSEPAKELEPTNEDVRAPESVRVLEMEAVPEISKLPETDAPALNVFSAVQVLAMERDAGPPAPQLRERRASGDTKLYAK